jgi:hypothetical protein
VVVNQSVGDLHLAAFPTESFRFCFSSGGTDAPEAWGSSELTELSSTIAVLPHGQSALSEDGRGRADVSVEVSALYRSVIYLESKCSLSLMLLPVWVQRILSSL